MLETKDSLQKLRSAFQEKNLTLYLGAGISIGSSLPSWEKLVLAMYFSKISQENLGGWRPFSNYLYAIAEWYLDNSTEPLEIIARKVRRYYSPESEISFLDDLYLSLYGSFLVDGQPSTELNSQMLRGNNATLNSVAKLCESDSNGIHAIVTYNYDSLLEIALNKVPYQTIFKSTPLESNTLPIYHVHGYVPLDRETTCSEGDEIVFTEDQYHQVAQNPYYWSNLVQLQLMSNSVGLMVGLSLSDRNMRRILDAIRNSPINSDNFALLKEPDIRGPEREVIDDIHHKAIDYLDEFENSGIKSEQRYSESVFFPQPGVKSGKLIISRGGVKGGERYQFEIAEIIEQIKLVDKKLQENVNS